MAEGRVERKLAAILAADIVAYSRMMSEDEAGTLARLKTFRHELLEPKTKDYCGRIFKTTGDGAMVEFKSATDAVNCAIDIQRALAAREEGVAEHRQIRLRIGISLGDVIVEGSDLYGNGVNVASRMEGLAEPGSICISGNVHEHVRGAVEVGFDDLGKLQVKNIPDLVHAYRVHLDGRDITRCDRQQPNAPLKLPDRPSIAVLPFQNMSGDPEQDYFCDGIVEDIITNLSRIRWLFVIARNSSFKYKGKAPDVRTVGRELGVRYVLEGSVRRVGGRVRITCQLIEAATAAHLWAERYDRSLDDVFALQDEITLAIVAAIEPNLRAAEIEQVKRKRPESLDAYDLVLHALPEVYTGMPAGAAKGLTLIERALLLEPNYALAHGLASWAHEILFVRAGMREENYRGAIDHAHAAIAYGRSDPMALTFGAFSVALVEHDQKTAFEAFDEAVKLCPSCAPAYIFGSCSLSFAGQAERAIDWGEQAVRLSPFDPLRYVAYHGISIGNFQLGRYEQAANAARKAIQAPGFSFSYALLAASLARLGRLEEAKAVVAQLRELQQSNSSINRQCTAAGMIPAVVDPLIEALCAAGLPD
jgi:adenylate cyclase